MGVSGGVPRLVSNSGSRIVSISVIVFDSPVGSDHPEPRCVVLKFELEVFSVLVWRCDKFVAKFIEPRIPLVKVNECSLELASSLFVSFFDDVDVIDNAKWSALNRVEYISNPLFIDVVKHPGNAKAGLVGFASERVVGRAVEVVGRHDAVHSSQVEKKISIFFPTLRNMR